MDGKTHWFRDWNKAFAVGCVTLLVGFVGGRLDFGTQAAVDVTNNEKNNQAESPDIAVQDPDDLLNGVKIDSLNRARLNGMWAVHGDSFQWVSGLKVLRVEADGKALVSTDDANWVWESASPNPP